MADIDWECEVHHNYQEKNYGCDPSEYMAQKWAFSLSDKCIVLEDDDVPAVSFFGFCKELLDKYEHDTRISIIAGFNNEEITPTSLPTTSSPPPSPSGDGELAAGDGPMDEFYTS